MKTLVMFCIPLAAIFAYNYLVHHEFMRDCVLMRVGDTKLEKSAFAISVIACGAACSFVVWWLVTQISKL